MSTIDKIVGALTRQGSDDAFDVAAMIYTSAWIVAGFLLFMVILGVIAGEVQ